MYRELKAYKLAFRQAMDIYNISKLFPKEEKYSLTDQVRRSSRSVCANIGEAYRKRQYKPYFINKLSDSDMENTETIIWIDFAFNCDYINSKQHKELIDKGFEIGRILNFMIRFPEKFLPKNSK